MLDLLLERKNLGCKKKHLYQVIALINPLGVMCGCTESCLYNFQFCVYFMSHMKLSLCIFCQESFVRALCGN